jgi:competence protein ComEA
MGSERNAERRFRALLLVSAVIAVGLVAWPRGGAPVRSVVVLDGPEAGVYATSEATISMASPDPLLVGQPIDLNTADEALLDEIPGVGATLAAAIVAERSRGPYRDLADLDARVPKLSANGLDGVASFGTFGGPFPEGGAATAVDRTGPHASAVARANGKIGVRPGSLARTLGARRASKKSSAKGRLRPVDPNTATVAQLDTLPGIGPAIAARIVADRAAHGPYASVDELERVSGVGPATVERLRQLVEIH